MWGKVVPATSQRREGRFPRGNHLPGRFAGCGLHPGGGFDILERQVVLVGVMRLGLRAERIAAHLREQSLQPGARLLDRGKARFRLDARRLGSRSGGFGRRIAEVKLIVR